MRTRILFRLSVCVCVMAAAALLLGRPRPAQATMLCSNAFCISGVCQWASGGLCAGNPTGCSSTVC